MGTVLHDIRTVVSARAVASVFCTVTVCALVAGCTGSGQGTGVGSGPAVASAATTPPAAIPASSPRATVWLFISTDCPICNGYQPEIERLRMRFATRGIEFVGVYAEVPLERSEMEAHVAKYGIKYPVRIDTDRAIQRRLGARMVPEVVVSAGGPDSSGNPAAFLYRGRIDDQWPERGSRRPSATVHDLERALEAIVAGQQPAVRTTTPVGCVL
ncbi:MAG: hypothetical protein EBU31_04635 [Proteobacteria bacterium]|nr:hypothetical protein [Pseudomonadota bacterium]